MINAFSDIERIAWRYENELYKLWDELKPVMLKAYAILRKEGKMYDVNATRHDNIGNNMWTDDHNIYAGILDGYKYGKAMIFSPDGSVDFVVLFNEKEHVGDCQENIPKGVRIFRVFNEIDIKCIEESWGLTKTTKWITSSDLVTDTFTDVTEHSQVIREHTVCKRPTVTRLLKDLNNSQFQHYGPIFCTSTRHYCRDFSMIEYCINNMILLCVRLELPGVKL